MIRTWSIAIVVVHAFSAFGNNDPAVLATRHERIAALYAAEAYADAVKAIEKQLMEVVDTPWQDSIYLYTYKYGRSKWRTADANAGVAAAEHIWELVKRHDPDPVHHIEALSDLSWIYYEVGRLKECVRVDSTAIAVADRSDQVPLLMKARTRQYLAFDHSAMGAHAKAAHYFLEARSIYSKMDSLPRMHISESCNGAGVSYMHLGHMADAEKNFNLALKYLSEEEESPAAIGRRANTYGNLGVLFQSAGDLTRSRSYYHESLKATSRVIEIATDPFTRDEAVLNRSRSYLNLATIYYAVGEMDRARELLEMCAKDRSTVLESDDPQLLAVQDRLADLDMAQGDLAAAAMKVEAYVQACASRFGDTSADHTRALAKLAEIHARNGDTTMAASLFQRSIDLRQRTMDPATDRDLGLILQRRATISIGQGRYSGAIADLERSAGIFTAIHGAGHHRIAECAVRMAEAAYRSGDLPAALRKASFAMEILADRARILKKNDLPQLLPQAHLLSEAILWKVKSERGMLAPDAPLLPLLEELDLAVLSMERNKIALHDEDARLAFVGAQKALFDVAIDIAYEVYQREPSEQSIDRFIALSEADRSILLRNRLNMFASIRFAGLPEGLIAREQQLLRALEVDRDDPATAQQLHENERAFAAFLDSLAKASPQYHALRYGAPPVTLSEVRKHLLRDRRQLLAYVKSEDHLYALVVRNDTAVIVRLPDNDRVQEVKELRVAVERRDGANYRDLSYALYRSIVQPVEHLLVDEGLSILPDAELHTLNFEALLTGPHQAGSPDPFLLRRHSISYLLSLTTAVQFAQTRTDRASGILALAPGFSDQLKQQHVAQVTDSSMLDRKYLHLVRQPFAVRTAGRLGGLLSANVLLGMHANEKEFRANADRYNVLHLGTHAELNAISPLYSRLVLSKLDPSSDPSTDGYLHAYEIYELELRAQLAVLSACETGAGRNDEGEGVRSLGHSFAYAGCPSLVMSLWSIDEKVSSEIIGRFYEHLADGMPKDRALRQAKLDHLENAQDELVLPYYWAGMVLVGDIEALDLGRPWYLNRLWVVLAIILLIVMVIVLRRRTRA